MVDNKFNKSLTLITSSLTGPFFVINDVCIVNDAPQKRPFRFWNAG